MNIKYPSLKSINRLYPNPEILLGKEIFWQCKRDGSNIGVRVGKNNQIYLQSRNKKTASKDFHKIFKSTDQYKGVIDLLISQRDIWNDECIVFGELLCEGLSPTRIEDHKKNSFVVFDIWSNKAGGFISYTLVYQHCYHFNLPVVELYGTSKHTTIASLYLFRDKMLEISKIRKVEGIVGKTYEKNLKFKYFKEKLDTPKLEKLPRLVEEGVIQLPQLDVKEIYGAVDKAIVDLGFEAFREISIAMPLIAKYVASECKKHNCKNNKKLFRFYKERSDLIDKQS